MEKPLVTAAITDGQAPAVGAQVEDGLRQALADGHDLVNRPRPRAGGEREIVVGINPNGNKASRPRMRRRPRGGGSQPAAGLAITPREEKQSDQSIAGGEGEDPLDPQTWGAGRSRPRGPRSMAPVVLARSASGGAGAWGALDGGRHRSS